jgi:hypothetical protein
LPSKCVRSELWFNEPGALHMLIQDLGPLWLPGSTGCTVIVLQPKTPTVQGNPPSSAVRGTPGMSNDLHSLSFKALLGHRRETYAHRKPTCSCWQIC